MPISMCVISKHWAYQIKVLNTILLGYYMGNYIITNRIGFEC